MAIALKLERDPGTEVLRLLRKELADALHLLQMPQPDASTWRNAIHDARRALRRMRALLQLLPAKAGAQVFLPRLREAGHALSPLRDVQALLETLATLHRQHPELLGSAHAALLPRLTRGVRAGERAHAEGVQHAVLALQNVAADLDGWQLQFSHAQLWRGLRRGAARAARAARTARTQPDPHNLHRWRRRMREHVLQLELVARCWPAVMSAQIAERKRLARMLGHLRDLSMLQLRVRRLRSRRLGRLSRDTLLERLRAAREEQLQDALALGALVHAEPPRVLVARIAGYHAHAGDCGPLA